jgi:hypothetical protein
MEHLSLEKTGGGGGGGWTLFLNDLVEIVYVSEKNVTENKWSRRSTRAAGKVFQFSGVSNYPDSSTCMYKPSTNSKINQSINHSVN